MSPFEGFDIAHFWVQIFEFLFGIFTHLFIHFQCILLLLFLYNVEYKMFDVKKKHVQSNCKVFCHKFKCHLVEVS